MGKHSFIIEKSSLHRASVTKRIDVEGTREYVMQYIAGYIQGCEDNNNDETATFKIMHHYINGSNNPSLKLYNRNGEELYND